MTVEIDTDEGKKQEVKGQTVDDRPQAEKKAEQAKRKPMPEVEVPDAMVDYRAKQLDKLNAKDDGYEYSYTSREKAQDVDMLDMMNAEVVKHQSGPKKGRLMHHEGDPIIRRKKDEVEAKRVSMGKFSEQQVRNAVKSRKTTQYARPKRPE